MIFFLVLFLPWPAPAGDAKKVLKFDPEKGVIMIDEGEARGKKKEFAPPGLREKKTIVIEEKIPVVSPHVVTEPASDTAFYRTGLRFFRSGDFGEALKYFENAWRKKQEPLHLFWRGVCLRNLDRFPEMEAVFKEILDRFSQSEVADDALFYLADRAQKNNDYQLSNVRLRDLIELYPAATSVMGDLDYREEAKKRIRVMKIDIVSRLKMLDYGEKNPVELLKTFQRDNGLPLSGQPDQKTVALLIQKSDAIEHKISKKMSQSEAIFNKRLVYYGLTLFLLVFNMLWGLRNISAAADRLRRVELLSREAP